MPSSNADTIRELYEAFGARDVPKVFSFFDPAVEILQSPQVPWGGRYEGQAQAMEFFAKLTGTISSKVTLERLVEAGEHVVAIGFTRGTVVATGRPFDVPVAHVWTLRDGKVVRVEYYIDNPTMLAALGA